jgi:hypothetical protein
MKPSLRAVHRAAMEEITIWTRLAQNLIDRISGPMNFRFILRQVMASIFAIVAGLKDAKAGKPPYFWSLLTGRARRVDSIKDGWKSKVIIVALVFDLAHQIIVLRFVYPVRRSLSRSLSSSRPT